MSNFAELRRRLYAELPEYARTLILSPRYRNHQDPFRQDFAQFPDDPRMHSLQWHQWGVVSHTVKVGEQFETTLPVKLQEWFGPALGRDRLGLGRESIEGVCKWELLLSSVPTHDWGKFTLRGLAKGCGDKPKFRFFGHEAESGALVRERSLWFEEQGVSRDQLEYIARCSELHFELGKLRDMARNKGGYNLEWVGSDDFLRASAKIGLKHPGFEREIGLFFLADSWGKTDLMDSREFVSDRAIADLKGDLKRQVKDRGLEPNLIECALQLPINTAVGRRFLEWVVDQTTGFGLAEG